MRGVRDSTVRQGIHSIPDDGICRARAWGNGDGRIRDENDMSRMDLVRFDTNYRRISAVSIVYYSGIGRRRITVILPELWSTSGDRGDRGSGPDVRAKAVQKAGILPCRKRVDRESNRRSIIRVRILLSHRGKIRLRRHRGTLLPRGKCSRRRRKRNHG